MPDNGVILVVTDAGTKQHNLEESIRLKCLEKNIKIFIAFSPKCLAPKPCKNSMPVYNRLSEGRIFNRTDFDHENFFKSVIHTVRYFYTATSVIIEENCVYCYLAIAKVQHIELTGTAALQKSNFPQKCDRMCS